MSPGHTCRSPRRGLSAFVITETDDRCVAAMAIGGGMLSSTLNLIAVSAVHGTFKGRGS